ncbi:peptidase M22, glycoprotease [Myriangium duriaei CBS 260.36]|uniref:Peptidase M22, glycoprotease n=1 Tax=Myriangium duriaei CBS 260.36 TaxID=1168546 RepID=A0A9P4J5T8_9PEZI|nr:peptidase M22, glycoprotease [Myriangium duriaei CBS 260.36]
MWRCLASPRRAICRGALQPWLEPAFPRRRGLLTLAIETSCDDTSVALLERRDHKSGPVTAKLHFHDKITANNEAYGGIHPIVALESHQASLGLLVQRALLQLPRFSDGDRIPASTDILWGSDDGQLRKKPDFISVTRGPGMRSNLSVGLGIAKGLALAWNIPLVGVHHMQAHALTPRLMTALAAKPSTLNPDFPFLSLLASGGHTILISSNSLVEHRVLASTGDIAIGEYLDKSARLIVPADLLTSPYGKALEAVAFPNGEASYNYSPPKNRGQELERRESKWGWILGPPLGESRGGRSVRRMEYSFSGLLTAVQRATGAVSPTGVTPVPKALNDEERQVLAKEAQRVAFEHLCGRLILHLKDLPPAEREQVSTVVVSGGVAANQFLRHVFRSMLDVQGFDKVDLIFPPVQFCTDNAAMIAWAGCEMYAAGWRSDLTIGPIRKWSLDPEAEDGGILGVSGNQKV